MGKAGETCLAPTVRTEISGRGTPCPYSTNGILRHGTLCLYRLSVIDSGCETMCDTVVATGAVTADQVTLFGKNSDREPNEAHYVQYIPAGEHPPESRVKCTYLEIPQAEKTYAVLLAKPFWMWGAEMGANEH